MKRNLYIFTLLFIIVITGCSSSDNSKKINDGIQESPAKNSLIKGENNIPPAEEGELLHTALYNMPAVPTDDYSSVSTIEITGQGIPFQFLKNQINFKKHTNLLEETHHKDKNLMQHIIDFNKFVEDNNIKPIEKDPYMMRKPPANITINTVWKNIYVLQNGKYKTIDAKCIGVSANAYFFIDTAVSNITSEQLELVKTSFDKDYNIVHEKFGTERDVDNNGKVIFLITELPEQIMGFFYSADKYTDSSLGGQYHSNEADILYVNYLYFAQDMWAKYQTDVLATFIHEFQHMTLFDTRRREGLDPNISVWLNEGLSMLAEYYGGYALPHTNYIYSFLSNHQGYTLIDNTSSLDYGYSLLFTRYMQERFGDSFVKGIYKAKATGVYAVTEATGFNFNSLFQDFTNMVLLTGRNITTDPRYNIPAFNHSIDTQEFYKNGFNLAYIVDEVYSKNRFDNLFITTAGYKTEFMPYSFRLTTWFGNFNSLYLSGQDAAGFYASY